MHKIKYSTNETKYSFSKLIKASENSTKNNTLSDQVTFISTLNSVDTKSKLEVKPFKVSDSKYFVTQVLNDEIVSSKEIFPELIAEYITKLETSEKELSIFIKAFKNQRKMHKFTLASIAYEDEEISDEEFEEIAEKCTLNIKNSSEEDTYDNILSLLKYTDTDDNFTIDELSELLEVSRELSAEIVYKVKCYK